MSRVKKRALSLLLAALMVFNTIPNMPEMVAHAAGIVNGTYEFILDETEFALESGKSVVIEGRASWSNASPSDATPSNAPWEASPSNAKVKVDVTGDAVEIIDKDNILIAADGTFSVEVKGKTVNSEVKAYLDLSLEGHNSDYKERVTITVKPEEPDKPKPGVKVESIEITGEKSVKVGEKITLTATATPSNAENKNVEWVVGKEASKFVSTTVKDNKLIVTGIEASEEVEVTAKATDGSNVTATYTFKVTDNGSQPPVETDEKVIFDGWNTSEIDWAMSAGLTKTFKAVVLPTGSNQNVKWTSSNEEVATVVDGVVKAKAEGNVQIKAISAESTDDKEIAAVCNLVVVEPKLLLEYYNLELVKGNKRDFLISVENFGIGGDNAGEIKVVSSNPDVVDAKVNEVYYDVINLDAKSVGTSVITVSLDGGIEATCNVKVSASATTATEIDNVIYDILDVFRNPEATDDEKKAVLEKAISVAAEADFANVADVEALSQLEGVILSYLDGVIVRNDYYESGSILELETIVGAYMNLLDYAFKGETGITPMLKVIDVEVPSNGIPSADTKPHAADITLSAKTDKSEKIAINDLKVPVILILKKPAGLGETDGKILKIRHLDSNGISKGDITPVINDDNTITFGTDSFSTFIFHDAPTGSSYNPSGGGNSGGSGIGSSGNLAGTWVQDATGWWFKTTTNDFPANEWAKINNKWYHFDAAGYMQTGWINVNNVWYFLNADGAMAENAWVNHNNKWYYVHTNGTMLASQWLLDNGSWYYLNADGSMAVSTTTPDGNTVNADGVWIQ